MKLGLNEECMTKNRINILAPSQLESYTTLLLPDNFLNRKSKSLDCMIQQSIVNVSMFKIMTIGTWLRRFPIRQLRQTWSLGRHLSLLLDKKLAWVLTKQIWNLDGSWH